MSLQVTLAHLALDIAEKRAQLEDAAREIQRLREENARLLAAEGAGGVRTPDTGTAP